MFTNILISGLGISYPEDNPTTYEELEEHFSESGMRIKSTMKILGKEKRFGIQNDTEYYSLLEEAANRALADANKKAEDMDMVIVVADTPEYISPTNSVKIAKIIHAVNAKVIFDMNATCTGSVVAMDIIGRYMASDPGCNHALVISAFFGSFIRREEDPISYGTFSDSSSAFVLEKKEEDIKRGIIEACYKADVNYDKMDVFPTCGFKNVYLNKNREDADLKLDINNEVNLDFIPDAWSELILELLKKTGREPDDISKYIFSQFSEYHIKMTMVKMKQRMDKTVYTGNLYGYNGSCSPIFALEYAKRNELVKKDDTVILCGVGAGYTCTALLYLI